MIIKKTETGIFSPEDVLKLKQKVAIVRSSLFTLTEPQNTAKETKL